MKISLINGLGTRVIMLAKALSTDPRPEIDWAVGPECSCPHRLIFPDGIPGLTITDSITGNRIGFLWDPKVDAAQLPAAVKLVFASMKLEPEPVRDFGVLYRGHFGEGVPFYQFLDVIDEKLPPTVGAVPTVCDSRRAEVLACIGPSAIPQKSKEMDFDYDRSPDDVRDYLQEWWRLLNCRKIIANNTKSSIYWPHQYL
jgi:hypothetical protein